MEIFVLIFGLPAINYLFKYKYAALMILSLIGLEFYHKLYFGSIYEFSTIRAVIITYIIGFSFANNNGYKFIFPYIKIIYFFSLISLVLYFLSIVSPSLIVNIKEIFSPTFVIENVIYGEKQLSINPIFYNFNFHLLDFRNNGPFWEPTVFAFHLILSIMFSLILNKDILNKYTLVSFFCLITTVSSTGYFAFFFLSVGLIFINSRLKKIYKLLLLVASILSIYWAYTNLDFLGNKLSNEVDGIEYAISEKNGDTRLASAILDWRESTQKLEFLFLGKGTQKETRMGSGDINALRNNGFTGLIVQRGLIFSMFYLYGIYLTFYQLSKKYNRNTKWSLLFLGTLIILSQSEILFDLYFLHSLAFLGSILKANESRLLNKNH